MAQKQMARRASLGAKAQSGSTEVPGWIELWQKEDWWAIWLGLGIVIAAIIAYLAGGTIKPIAVKPATWGSFTALRDHFAAQYYWYLLQFLLWAAVLGISTWAMGWKLSEFLPSFLFVYVASLVIFAIGQWKEAGAYNLEPPLVALVLGLLISNLLPLPAWMDAGFRVEYYIKTGIVLLGATLPFTLIIWAGPLAMLQATIVSVMIFLLPFASKALQLHAAVAGAWIGNSEFADAAGLAAAQAYGGMAEASSGAIQGTSEQALATFTLMKVIGRDIWIGIWAFIFALIATLRWEVEATGARPSPAEIWWRFPKFVLGFLIASALVTLLSAGYSYDEYKKVVEPNLVAPLKDLRTWTFIFCFFSIGLTTRFREFAGVGSRPFLGFTAGVVINVILGFLLSAVVFARYWTGVLEAAQ